MVALFMFFLIWLKLLLTIALACLVRPLTNAILRRKTKLMFKKLFKTRQPSFIGDDKSINKLIRHVPLIKSK